MMAGGSVLIPPQWVEALDTALSQHGGGTHTTEDVLDQLLRGHARMWQNEKGILVTEVQDTPRARVLNLWLATGEYEAIRALAHMALEWGKQNGCTKASISGRKGWIRRLRDEDGWRATSITLMKDLT